MTKDDKVFGMACLTLLALSIVAVIGYSIYTNNTSQISVLSNILSTIVGAIAGAIVGGKLRGSVDESPGKA